jgi:RimJ/RimL family protein N-acetyltransferase
MPPLEVFHTDRLLARRVVADDFDDLFRMHQDALVMATLGGTRDQEQTRLILQAQEQHWEQHGYGIWVIRDRADGRFLGRGGLRHVLVEGNDEVEVAYALMSDVWGRGVATEFARAVVKVGFERLDLKDVVAFTLPTNRASRRIMEKVGFRYERDIIHADLPHVLYRLVAANLHMEGTR